jgi:16S rRNA (uracil1498-N3)-methyltransferase
MNLPYFYYPSLEGPTITLDEEKSKHVITVLRMKKGGLLLLTDGNGKKAEAEIIDDNRKKCTVQIVRSVQEEGKTRKLTIAISPTKNSSRFEWFLEKATEVGVTEIIPLICERTEKEKLRIDRMKNILVSAMLQSQQTYLPVLHEPLDFSKVLQLPFDQKFIAHCLDSDKQNLTEHKLNHSNYTVMLIGPEGDFTPAEVEEALNKGFMPVALGTTRLRTETAGIVAAVLLTIGAGH